MRRWKNVLLISGSLLFLILFAAAVILPEIIRDKAIEQVRSDYGRDLRIERIIINLFNLQVDIRKLDLKEPGSDRTFVSFDRLNFSLSLRSLIDRALIIDDLTLERPFVRIEKQGPESFNFSDFIPAESAPPAAPAEPTNPFLFSFNNLQIHDGTLTFVDSSDQLDLVHRIAELNLAVPFVGNIPYLVERYIQPALSLKIDDSPLVARGQMKPFHDSVETRLELNLNGVDLPYYAAYLKPFLPFELSDGRFSAQLELSYRVSRTQQPKLLIGGDLSLSALRLEQQGQTFFFLPLLLVQIDWINPFEDEYHFSAISLYDPQLQVERNDRGEINLLGLLPPESAGATSAEQPEVRQKKKPLPHLTIETLRLREGSIDFHDAVPPGGFSSHIEPINLLARELSTREAPPARIDFELQTSHKEELKLDADLNLAPLDLKGHAQLSGLPLAAYRPYLLPYLTRTPRGTVGLETDFSVTEAGQQLSHLNFLLSGLQQEFSDSDFFRLGTLNLTDASVRLPEREVEVSAFSLAQGQLVLSRDAQGTLPFESLLRPQPEPPQAETPQASEETATSGEKNAASPWSLKLAHFAIEDFGARFTDGAAPHPAPVEVKHLALQIDDLHWPQAAPSPWQFSADWGAGGALSAEGNLVHTPPKLDGKLRVKQFDLRPVNSYIPLDLLLKLASAKLDSGLTFDLAQGDRFGGQIKGEVGLRRFSVAGVSEELLRWESLQFEEIQFDLDPLALAIARVSLNNYLAKIRVEPDGRVNLNQIQAETETTGSETTPAADTPSAPTAVAAADAPSEAQAEPLPPIRIDEVTLQGGELSFVDRHLPQIFASTMYELGGRISGLNSAPGQSASVDLRGMLENHSPLTISGSIAPLAGDLNIDLRVRFNEIDLAPVTPYSGTYLGYVIDKGKLYLDLDYKIAKRQLQANNKIFLDQFTFGKAVESAEATGLPVRLAVALLKDRKGEIHLDLPVSGSTDDPQFGIFSTVVTLLKNLLVKAATAPFSLLASMFGGGGEDFSQISFPAGLAVLAPADSEKLGKLNQMLVERPGLNLELSGFIDPEIDPEGYRKEQLRSAVDAAWRKKSKPQPGQEMTPDEYLDNLEQVYKKASFPKPRNALGVLKKLPVAEMEKLLLANTLVGDEELTGLARERETAVKEELLKQNPELSPRIFLKAADIAAPAEKDRPRARVEFGVAVK